MDKKAQEFYETALKLHNGDKKALYEFLKEAIKFQEKSGNHLDT